MKIKKESIFLWLGVVVTGILVDYFIKDSGFSYCIGFSLGAFAQSILIFGVED